MQGSHEVFGEQGAQEQIFSASQLRQYHIGFLTLIDCSSEENCGREGL